MSTRRRHQRVRFTELVQFYLGDKLFRGRASNLSLGGVALEFSGEFAADADVRVYLPLRCATRRGSRFTAVWGRAVWQATNRIGVGFGELCIESIEQLARFVDYRQSHGV